MAVIGVGVGGLLRGGALKTALAAWLSVITAALACSVELAVGGTIPFGRVAPAMLGTHAIIGIGEALITGSVLELMRRVCPTPAIQPQRSVAAMSIGAVAVALLLSPFASSYPDGLEWVAAKYEFAHSQAPAFTGFLAGYELPHVRSAFWSKGLAGLLGATIVLAVALGVRRFIALDPWRPKSPAV